MEAGSMRGRMAELKDRSVQFACPKCGKTGSAILNGNPINPKPLSVGEGFWAGPSGGIFCDKCGVLAKIEGRSS
jgi:hypothetical protein